MSLCSVCDLYCVFCLNSEAWRCRFLYMERMSVSCRCCVLCGFCGCPQFYVLHDLQFGKVDRGCKGNHMEEAMPEPVSCFPHAAVVSV